MRYLADFLTFSRLVLAASLFFGAFFGWSPEAVLIIFVVAELTDVFDGTCATKWPFPKNKVPKYRQYSAKFDMFSDAFLAGVQALYLALNINLLTGVIIIGYYLISALVGDLIIYGKIFGHPDNCTPKSLVRKKFPLAKKVILARRFMYVACLIVQTLLILLATNWPTPIKNSLIILGAAILIFIWFFLAQRRHNISRDAVHIEKTLTQKSQKSSRK